MFRKPLLLASLLMLVTPTMNQPLAQSDNAAQRFSTDILGASFFSSDFFINVIGQRFASPFQDSGFAQVDLGDFTTGESKHCVSSNFDMTINNGRIDLSFITEAGFNCEIGEPIHLVCMVTDDTFVSNSILNGLFKSPFGQQKTQGRLDFFNNLSCELEAFGVQEVVSGFALKERNLGTPLR